MRKLPFAVALVTAAGAGFFLGKLSALPRSIGWSDLSAEQQADIIVSLAYPDHPPADVKIQELSGFKVYYVETPNAHRMILDGTNYRIVTTSSSTIVQFPDNSFVGVADLDEDGAFEHLEQSLPTGPEDQSIGLVDQNRDGIYDLKSVGDTLYYHFRGAWHGAVVKNRISGIVLDDRWQQIDWNGHEFEVRTPRGMESSTTNDTK